MTPTIHYVAGLPRSGSTLLLNLLAQHPAHHVTPTNGLINMISGVRDSWTKNDAFKAQGLQQVAPRVSAALRAMIYGFYERELAGGQVVFDKNRHWLAQAELLEEMFGRPIPIICPVRDVRAVVASFEKLHRKNPLVRRSYMGPAYIQAQTIDGRARVLMSAGGLVGMPVNFLRDAMNRGMADRVVMVPYRMLTHYPTETLAHLHERLGLSPWVGYDPEHVEQVTQEDDAIHGWGFDLHTIRSEVRPPEQVPWEGVLPPHTCKWLETEFADINRAAASVLPSMQHLVASGGT
jgi:sulfotransferase